MLPQKSVYFLGGAQKYTFFKKYLLYAYGLIVPKKLGLVSLESRDSTLSNDGKLNFFGSMRRHPIK